MGAYFTFRVSRRAGSAYLDKKFKKSRSNEIPEAVSSGGEPERWRPRR